MYLIKELKMSMPIFGYLIVERILLGASFPHLYANALDRHFFSVMILLDIIFMLGSSVVTFFDEIPIPLSSYFRLVIF